MPEDRLVDHAALEREDGARAARVRGRGVEQRAGVRHLLGGRCVGGADHGDVARVDARRRGEPRRGRVRGLGAQPGAGARVGLPHAEAADRHLDDPAGYERAWSRATRDYRVLTSGLLAWAGSPARRAIVPAASAAPWLYGAVVERLAR